MREQTFGDNACHPERSEGSGATDAELLRCAQDDSQDPAQVLALAEELSNLERQAGYRAGLALVARGRGDLEGATALFEEALTLITERGFWHLRTRILLWLAETLLLRGHLHEKDLPLSTALTTA